MRYACIDRRRNRYPIRLLCRLLQVSPSGYYAWRVRAESRRSRYDRDLMRAIRFTHAESDGTYGSPRIHAELSAQGFACGRAKVARLMHEAGLKGCPKRRFRVTPNRGLARARNLLDQNFTAATANQRWASDITFIGTGQGWLYLAVVMDLYSRRIVGWSMSRRINRHLVVNALNMALDQRRPGNDLIHHSDRGMQGEFNRSSQHSGIGGCYDGTQTAVGSVWTEQVAFARSTGLGTA